MSQEARNWLKQRYSNSKKWAAKVDKMSDAQAIAVKMRLQNADKK